MEQMSSYIKMNIGLASITQVMHVRNKNSNIKGRSPKVVKIIP